MKTKHILVALGLSLMGGFTACDVTELTPKDSITDESFWNTVNDLESYAKGFYKNLIDSNADNLKTLDGRSDMRLTASPDQWLFDEWVIASNADDNSGWTWDNIRNLNYFMSRYQQVEAPESDEHEPNLRFYSEETIAANDQAVEKLLEERYQHVQKVVKQNKRKLLRLAKSLLKYETLSGENAKRVMEGKKPILGKREDTEENKKFIQLYRTMSLVHMFMLSDGELVNRIKLKEEETQYQAVKENVMASHGATLDYQIPMFRMADLFQNKEFAEMVKKKYWELLDERSLKDIDWEGLSEKYK